MGLHAHIVMRHWLGVEPHAHAATTEALLPSMHSAHMAGSRLVEALRLRNGSADTLTLGRHHRSWIVHRRVDAVHVLLVGRVRVHRRVLCGGQESLGPTLLDKVVLLVHLGGGGHACLVTHAH